MRHCAVFWGIGSWVMPECCLQRTLYLSGNNRLCYNNIIILHSFVINYWDDLGIYMVLLQQRFYFFTLHSNCESAGSSYRDTDWWTVHQISQTLPSCSSNEVPIWDQPLLKGTGKKSSTFIPLPLKTGVTRVGIKPHTPLHLWCKRQVWEKVGL